MPFAGRRLPAAFTLCLVTLVTLAACSGGGGGADECLADEECAEGARCTGGTCVVNRAPVAALEVPTGAEAFAIATLDASGSSDPDPGDAVGRHAWRVLPVDAACEAPVIAGTGATAQARFGCPGRFAVEVTAFDALGAASAPAVRELEILPSSAAPLLSAVADVVVGHRCAGDPLVCTVATDGGVVTLGAAATTTPLRLRWVAVPPPGLALDGARRVTFDPSPEVIAPSVRIEADGVAIAGDWVFRLEAHDDFGVIGATSLRVSITNTDPVIEATPSAVPHRFDAAASRFTASGEIAVLAYDADGDPIDRQLVARAVSTGPATFAVVDLGDRITFSIQVPYAAPSDAGYLIGGAGLERSISMVLRDSNGAEARETWPVVVDNEAPALAWALRNVSVDHRFDPLALAYRAEATLSTFTDPEGDPLFPAGPTGDVVCPDVAIAPDGAASVACSHPYVGTPALANFAGSHTIVTGARDPWADAPTRGTTRLDILNRPPVRLDRSYSAEATCSAGSCCVGVGSTCEEYALDYGSAVFRADGFVTDPDGDPLTVTSRIATTVCELPACAVDVAVEPGSVCIVEPVGTAPYTASDGVATLSAGIPVTIACR